jgi:hypothetical protein
MRVIVRWINEDISPSSRAIMGSNVRDVASDALRLPRRSRALLADLLLDSLDEGSAESHEEAWLKVAQSRDAELSDGTAQPVGHEQVMRVARESIKCSK